MQHTLLFFIIRRMRIAFFLVLPIFLVHCDGDDPEPEVDQLPAATKEGLNTFGCLVDGKAWVVTGQNTMAAYEYGNVDIGAVKLTETIYIYLNVLDEELAVGEYSLPATPPSKSLHIAAFDATDIDACDYQTMANYTGKLIITHLDEVNFIISGTFEFDAYSEECQKEISITEGRFDLKYR